MTFPLAGATLLPTVEGGPPARLSVSVPGSAGIIVDWGDQQRQPATGDRRYLIEVGRHSTYCRY